MCRLAVLAVLAFVHFAAASSAQEAENSGLGVQVLNCAEGQFAMVVERQDAENVLLSIASFLGEGDGQDVETDNFVGWEAAQGTFFFQTPEGFIRLTANTLLRVNSGEETTAECEHRNNERLMEALVRSVIEPQSQEALRAQISNLIATKENLTEQLISLQADYHDEAAARLIAMEAAEALQEQLDTVSADLSVEQAKALALGALVRETEAKLSQMELERSAEVAVSEALRTRVANLERETAALSAMVLDPNDPPGMDRKALGAQLLACWRDREETLPDGIVRAILTIRSDGYVERRPGSFEIAFSDDEPGRATSASVRRMLVRCDARLEGYSESRAWPVIFTFDGKREVVR